MESLFKVGAALRMDGDSVQGGDFPKDGEYLQGRVCLSSEDYLGNKLHDSHFHYTK